MARIAGINIPVNKHAVIALRSHLWDRQDSCWPNLCGG